MYRIAICDDEKVFGDDMKRMLRNFSLDRDIALDVSVFCSGIKLLEEMKAGKKFDILFLDILMEDMSGVEVGKVIREELHDYNTAIIYISSTQEYALELFQNQPMDFIDKPVSDERLSGLILKYIDIQKRQRKVFSYHKGNQIQVIALNDIMYFESSGRKVRIVMPHGTDMCYCTMKKLVELYEFADFIQCHNAYFVNINYVKEVTAHNMILINDVEVPISTAKRKHVFDKLRMREMNIKA